MKLKPALTQEQFEELHRAADVKRSKITVDREALAALLMDHAQLWEKLGV